MIINCAPIEKQLQNDCPLVFGNWNNSDDQSKSFTGVIYAKKDNLRERQALINRIKIIPEDQILSIHRFIQIAHCNTANKVPSIKHLKEKEIDLKCVPDSVVMDINIYLNMQGVDKNYIMDEDDKLELKSSLFSLAEYDKVSGLIPIDYLVPVWIHDDARNASRRCFLNPHAYDHHRLLEITSNGKYDPIGAVCRLPAHQLWPVYRMIQLVDHYCGNEILTLDSLMQNDIAVKSLHGMVKIGILNYLNLLARDKVTYENRFLLELESKARYHGLQAFDGKLGACPKDMLHPVCLQATDSSSVAAEEGSDTNKSTKKYKKNKKWHRKSAKK